MENKIQKLDKSVEISGYSLKGSFSGYTFVELYAVLGAPTSDIKFDIEADCVVEWKLKFNDDIFTLYDWPHDNRLYVLSENDVWHVSGTTSARDFIDHLLDLLDQNKETNETI